MGVRTSGPGANLAFDKKVTASRFGKGFEPNLAVDGNTQTWWGASDFPPQWIEIDLGSPSTIAVIRLKNQPIPCRPDSASPAGQRIQPGRPIRTSPRVQRRYQ